MDFQCFLSYLSIKSVSPVVGAPLSVPGLHDVESVDVAGVLRGIFSTAVHHLPVDQYDPTWVHKKKTSLPAVFGDLVKTVPMSTIFFKFTILWSRTKAWRLFLGGKEQWWIFTFITISEQKISTQDSAVRTQKTNKGILIMILSRYNTTYRCKSLIWTFELDKEQKRVT